MWRKFKVEFEIQLEIFIVFWWSLKGLSVIVNSKFHFFPNPQIFLHIQRERHCNNLPIQQIPRNQHIFGKRDNSLLLGINHRRRWLIQASVSSKKSFKSWFYEVLVYFSIWRFWDSKIFNIILLYKCFMCFIERATRIFILKFREQCSGPMEWNLMKNRFLSNLCDWFHFQIWNQQENA